MYSELSTPYLEDGVAVADPQQRKKLPFYSRLFKRDGKKFMKYAKSTSTHGVRHIFEGKSKVRRSFWAILFLAATGVCLFSIIDSVLYYGSTPTATTVSTRHVGSLPFPAVTVCNLNAIKKSYVEEKNLTSLIQSAVKLKNINPSEYVYQQQCINHSATNNAAEDISYRQILIEASQELEDFLVNCNFLGRPCNISRDFRPFFTQLGLCYTFNSGKDYPTRQVEGSGSRHALELILNIQQEEYAFSLDKGAGVRVTVHNQDEPPRPLDLGIAVAPGRNAFISLSAIVYNDRSDTENCKKADEPHNFQILRDYEYSLPACLIDCLCVNIAEICHCIYSIAEIPEDGQYSNLSNCRLADICCGIGTILQSNECHCAKPCDHMTYTTATSYSAFPALNEVDNMAEIYNVTVESLQHSFLAVHVYFEELQIKSEITVRSYSIIALMSDIGGTLGLFLGASVLSLTELLVWIIDEIKDRCFGVSDRMMKEYVKERFHEDLQMDDQLTVLEMKQQAPALYRSHTVEYEQSTSL